jgi:uncharacterized short protein YbdD (DUF466 family)
VRKDDAFKNVAILKSMSQPIRELTPQEVAEGQRGINDQQLSATQVQALVRRMDASKTKWRRIRHRKDEYEQKLKEENEQLYFNYPSLFQLHAEDKLDATFFEMLNLKRKIEKGEITAEQASAIVGQRLFQKYVPHAISGTPPPAPAMSYEEYYRQTQGE